MVVVMSTEAILPGFRRMSPNAIFGDAFEIVKGDAEVLFRCA